MTIQPTPPHITSIPSSIPMFFYLELRSTYQPFSFLVDNQAKILPIPPENRQIPLFCANLWCIMPIHFEWTRSIFKQKHSKSSNFDTFLKQRFICRLVGMGLNYVTKGPVWHHPRYIYLFWVWHTWLYIKRHPVDNVRLEWFTGTRGCSREAPGAAECCMGLDTTKFPWVMYRTMGQTSCVSFDFVAVVGLQ